MYNESSYGTHKKDLSMKQHELTHDYFDKLCITELTQDNKANIKQNLINTNTRTLHLKKSQPRTFL